MGQTVNDNAITAPMKTAEDRAKEIVQSGDTEKVAEILKENDALKQPRTAELRTTEGSDTEGK